MRKFKNYIFDFDGTLMDTAPVIMATMHDTIAEMGLPEKSEADCRSSIGLRLEEIPAFLFPERPGIGAEYAATYRRMFPKHNRPGQAAPFPGVIATLNELHNHGARLAIASSRSHASLKDFTDDMGITDCFAQLVGGDDVKIGKPKPDPVLRILADQRWSATETLVVGDADVDILMGKAAGCATCAVTYGNGSAESLAKAHPDFTINSFEDVLLCGSKLK